MKIVHHAARPFSRVLLVTALILCIPLVAMQFTTEVVWSFSDFVLAGALLAGTGSAYQLVTRAAAGTMYRAAVGVALAAMLLLIWVNLAVGIIGSEDNPANAMYAGVLAVAVVGSFAARFSPRGMTLVMIGAALAQGLIGAVAIVGGMGAPESGPFELFGITVFFITIWLIAAALFRQAADEESTGGVAGESGS